VIQRQAYKHYKKHIGYQYIGSIELGSAIGMRKIQQHQALALKWLTNWNIGY